MDSACLANVFTLCFLTFYVSWFNELPPHLIYLIWFEDMWLCCVTNSITTCFLHALETKPLFKAFVCARVCVCVCVCVCVRLRDAHAHTRTRTHAHTHTRTHAHMHTRTHGTYIQVLKYEVHVQLYKYKVQVQLQVRFIN